MRKTTCTLKRQHELKITNDAKSNPKAFCTYSRAHLKTKTGLAPFLGDPSDLSSISTITPPMQMYCNISSVESSQESLRVISL